MWKKARRARMLSSATALINLVSAMWAMTSRELDVLLLGAVNALMVFVCFYSAHLNMRREQRSFDRHWKELSRFRPD